MADKIEIKFGDYFTATLPRYKQFKDLKRNEAYYLSNVHDKLDNYINNPLYTSIPDEVLRSILVVELQKYDTMIDINGEEYDWSNGYPFTPLEREVENQYYYWFEKKWVDVNHVVFDDIMDIESSVVYNLIEIRPKSGITLDYLRYWLWYNPDLVTDGKSFLYEVYGEFCDNLERINGDSRYLYTCGLLLKQTAVVDNLSEHSSIIRAHNNYLDEAARAESKMALQALFGSPLYNNLKKLENRVVKQLTPDEAKNDQSSYAGFVRMLEESQRIFNATKERGIKTISTASIFSFYSACEIILRAKIKCILNTQVFAGDSFSSCIKLLKDNAPILFRRRLPTDEWREFFDDLNRVRLGKNDGSHTTETINIAEAENTIAFVCNKVIKNIDRYLC